MKALARWLAITIVLVTAGGIAGYIMAFLIKHETAKLLTLAIMFIVLAFGLGMKYQQEWHRKQHGRKTIG